jgi:hypothetical protein
MMVDKIDDTEEQSQEPEVVALVSNCLYQITFDPSDGSTLIEFKDGKQETYKTIPKEIFDTLASAPSAGAYYNRSIRGQYS